MMDLRLRVMAGFVIVLMGVCHPAWAYYDKGGRFSRSMVAAAPEPTPPGGPGPFEDEVAYVASHGNGGYPNDGSVWAFWKNSLCIDPESPDPENASVCDRLNNSCDTGEVCTPLWWVFSVTKLEITEAKNGKERKKIKERGRILSFPVLSADGETVYIGADNGFVYALPSRPPNGCINYTEGMGPKWQDHEEYEKVPKLKEECVKWQFNTTTRIRAAVGEDEVTGRVYVGAMTKRKALPYPTPYPTPTPNSAGRNFDDRHGLLWAFEPGGCCQVVLDPQDSAYVDPFDDEYGKPGTCTECDNNGDCMQSDPDMRCIGQVPDGWPAHTMGTSLRFQPIVHRRQAGNQDPGESDDDDALAIYVGSALPDGGLSAFDRNGNEIWWWDQAAKIDEERAPYPMGGVISAYGDVLYANSNDWVLALNLEGGEEVRPGARGREDVSLKWRHKGNLNKKTFTRQNPILFVDPSHPGDDLGIYQSHRVPGAVLKIDQNCHLDWDFSVGRGGRISYSTPAEGPVFGSSSSHRIVSGSHGTKGCLFALENGTSGFDKKWDFRPTLSTQSFFTSGAMSKDEAAGLLYMGTNDGIFYELDAAAPCAGGGGDCTSSDNLDRVRWCYDIWDPVNPNVMGTGTGRQDCWGPEPTPQPTSNGCAIETPAPHYSPCCQCAGDRTDCHSVTLSSPCPLPTPTP